MKDRLSPRARRRLHRAIRNILHLSAPNIHPVPAPRPFSSGKLAPVKIVLFDVYGTLLHSQRGEISIHRPKQGNSQPFSPLENSQHIGYLSRLLGGECTNEAELIQTIELALEAEIHAQHLRARARGVESPEVDIRDIWHTILHADSFRQPVAGVVPLRPRYTRVCIMQIALCWEMLINQVVVMPQAIDTFRRLRERGVVMGIISNAQFYTPLILEVLGGPLATHGFDTRLMTWSYHHGWAKPSARIFELALAGVARYYQVPANQILYVGNDMRNDIIPATHQGMQTALFAGDDKSLRLQESPDPTVTPTVCIQSLDDLLTAMN